MKLLILESYYGGSHQYWIDGMKKHSRHNIDVIALKGRHWKWRMHGGAISLAKASSQIDYIPDLIIATSMTDISILKCLLPKEWRDIPIHLYFHENQFSYPWSGQDQDKDSDRKSHYHFIQYSSALVSEKVYFNSSYNKESFLKGCFDLLKLMPDENNLSTIEVIKDKCSVLPLGMPWEKFDSILKNKKQNEIPIIVWNHRWEEDKNPNDFFKVLAELKKRKFAFKLCMLGESKNHQANLYEKWHLEFENEIIHWGKIDKFEDYISWLQKSDISIVTSKQDFFGISAVETIYSEVVTFLPNRLAFPEHLSKKGAEYLLYDDLDKLVEKVIAWRDIPTKELKDEVVKYNWKDVIRKYDSTIFSC